MSVLFFKHVAELFALFIGGIGDSFTALRLAARDSSASHYHNMNHYDEQLVGRCVSHDEQKKDRERERERDMSRRSGKEGESERVLLRYFFSG